MSPSLIDVVARFVVEDGRVESGADDGRVGGALAAFLAEGVLHEPGDLQFFEAEFHGLEGGKVRGHGGRGGVTDALHLARVLNHAHLGDERLHVFKVVVIGESVGAREPFERARGGRGFAIGGQVGEDDGARRGQNVDKFVAHFVEKFDLIEARDPGCLTTFRSQLGAGPTLLG